MLSSPVGKGGSAPRGVAQVENGLSPSKEKQRGRGKEIVKSYSQSIVKFPMNMGKVRFKRRASYEANLIAVLGRLNSLVGSNGRT